MDIASLGFSIDTSDVAKAETALDNLSATGAEAEAAAKGVSDALSGVKNEASGLSSAASSSSQALKQVGSAGKSAAQSGSELVAALREQITLFGKSTDDVLRYQAAQLGVQKTVEPLIVQLRQLHDAQEAANQAMIEEVTIMAAVAQSQGALSTAQYGFIEGLREQVALFGKTNLELVEFEAKMLGVSDAAEPLIQNLRELEAAQKRAEIAAREEAEAQRLAAQAKQSAASQQSAFLSSLREQVELQGKSAEEALEYKAAQLGVSQDAAGYIAQIRSFKTAQEEANNAQRRGGMSAAEYQQAIRMLPAQITDITTSLASGMPVWLVAIQQGGQIKDSFGGIGNAARALSTTISPLSLAVGAAAAAALALGVAWKQGAQESVEFNKAIILSGNQSGVTADQLSSMAAAIDGVVGTQRQAAAALTEVVGAGKFTADQLQLVATAAIEMEEATGKAVSDTVKEFKQLADEPAKASAKLSEETGYLTAAVYEQIAALEEQGNTSAAAALAIETYANAQIDAANKVEENLGLLEKAWKGIAGAASDAWDAMLDVGREQTLDDKISELRARLAEIQETGSQGPRGRAAFQLGLGGGNGEDKLRQELTFLEQQKQTQEGIAAAEALYREEQQKGIQAQRAIDTLEKQFLTNAEKRTKEIKEYRQELDKIRRANPADERLDEDRIAKNIANIEAKYKDPKAPKTKAFQDDAATRFLIQLREQQSELETQLLTTEKLTEAQKKRAAFESEIADLKEKKILTADQKSLLANESAIKAQLDKNVAVAEEVRLHNESLKLQERAQQLQASIQSSMEGRQEQQQRQLDAFGLGRQEQERADAERNIFREFRRYQDQLNKATPKDLLDSEEYRQATADIKKGLDDALRANQDYYAKLDQLREDSTNGQKAALEDYLDSAKDVAGQTYDLFSNAFAGLEDALVEFVMTGKLSFADLANAIIADLVRIEIRKAIAFSLGGEDGKSGLGGLLSSGLTALGAWFDGGTGLSGSAAASSAAGASQAGYAGDLSNFIAGGRALGGPVAANELYQVGENNRPELLRQGGKNYLIPGDNGQVIPMRGQGGGSVSVGQMVFPNVTDRRTAEESSFIMQRRLGQLVASTGRAQ